MAPEILNDQPYDLSVDVWSFGIAVFETLFKRMPFNGSDKFELIKNINNGIISIP